MGISHDSLQVFSGSSDEPTLSKGHVDAMRLKVPVLTPPSLPLPLSLSLAS